MGQREPSGSQGVKSIWIWLGCGCAAVVGVGIALVAVTAIFGIQTARTMADPEARRAKALTYLNAAALPAGYETGVAMKVPFLAEVVILHGDDAQFVHYGHLRTAADLSAAYTDDEAFEREIGRAGLTIRRGQALLVRDAFRAGKAEVRYALVDGRLDFDVTSNSTFDFDLGEVVAEEDDVDAQISAVILVRCSADDVPGLGLWAGPRVGPADDRSQVASPDADRAALRALIEQFRFCAG